MVSSLYSKASKVIFTNVGSINVAQEVYYCRQWKDPDVHLAHDSLAVSQRLSSHSFGTDLAHLFSRASSI
jgi:hypothetical protein